MNEHLLLGSFLKLVLVAMQIACTTSSCCSWIVPYMEDKAS